MAVLISQQEIRNFRSQDGGGRGSGREGEIFGGFLCDGEIFQPFGVFVDNQGRFDRIAWMKVSGGVDDFVRHRHGRHEVRDLFVRNQKLPRTVIHCEYGAREWVPHPFGFTRTACAAQQSQQNGCKRMLRHPAF